MEPMPKFIDLSGFVFGRLTVTTRAPNREYPSSKRAVFWNCQCRCGKRKAVSSQKLRRGETRSCGCLHSEVASRGFSKRLTTHGGSYSKEYNVWRGLLKRCENPKDKDYSRYGGRGIKVCKRWHDFSNFMDDMGPRPEGLTVERRNVNGDYEPSNCSWESWDVQYANRRNSKKNKMEPT